MSEPSRSTSRHVIAGATLAVIGVAAAGFALGRSTAEPPPAPPVAVASPAPTPSPTPTTVLPTVPPPLGRAELIAAAASAADAFASGRPLPAGVAALAGRAFDLSLPFGCPGRPQSESAPLGWQYDAEDEALRVRVEPVRWAPVEWLPPAPPAPATEPPAGTDPPERAEPAAAPELAAEAIEGFWIARPWMSSDTCPAAPALAAAGATPGEQTLGIAQYFAPDSSRVGRRDGRAYQAVERVAPDALNTSRGLRLRLRGTLARAPGGDTIVCRAPTGARPTCLFAATLNEVAIENPATDTTLATWDVSIQGRRPARP